MGDLSRSVWISREYIGGNPHDYCVTTNPPEWTTCKYGTECCRVLRMEARMEAGLLRLCPEMFETLTGWKLKGGDSFELEFCDE